MNGGAGGRARWWFLTGLITIAILVAGEGALRAWAYFFRHPYQHFNADLGMITLVPGYHGDIQGKVLRINSRGLRAAEFTDAKPPEVFRIIMLGDSVTFGLVGDDCHYPGVLQALLDADGSRRVEVVNAGVEGYNSLDALRLLNGQLLSYRPDMVTVLIGWNDLIKQDPGRPEASILERRLAYALYDVYLVKFWRRLIYFHLRPMVVRVRVGLTPEEEGALGTYVPLVYKEHLERIVATARGAGSQVVLFTLPSVLRPEMDARDMRKLYFPHFTYNLTKFRLLYERYNETIRAVGREMGVPVVETQEAVRGRESELFMDTAHLECAGYKVLARYLYPVFERYVDSGTRHGQHSAR
jgi:lysophospholipase L1-like esterase